MDGVASIRLRYVWTGCLTYGDLSYLQARVQSYVVWGIEKWRGLWIRHRVQILTCHFLAVRPREVTTSLRQNFLPG